VNAIGHVLGAGCRTQIRKSVVDGVPVDVIDGRNQCAMDVQPRQSMRFMVHSINNNLPLAAAVSVSVRASGDVAGLHAAGAINLPGKKARAWIVVKKLF
jgi:hypothetical protein